MKASAYYSRCQSGLSHLEPGYRYYQTGILLMDLTEDTVVQQDLFDPPSHEQSDKRMQTVDAINATFGRESIHFAAQGIQRPWYRRSDHRALANPLVGRNYPG